MYCTVCELSKKQFDNISQITHDYRSVLINLKLINSLFYKIVSIITKPSTNWRQSYILSNTISQMFSYVDKCNRVCILIIYFYERITKKKFSGII